MPNRLYIFFIASFFLISCGGGGGGSGSSADTVYPIASVNLSANQASVLLGNTVTLTWTSSNVTSCSASGAWTGQKGISGTETLVVNTAGNNIYTISCLRRTNYLGSNGTDSASVTVEGYGKTDGIYDEDKDSYCRNPSNTSNDYWLEDFSNNVFNSNIFTYQLGNGFNTSDGSWVSGWGNNELQYYTGPGNGYAENYDISTNTTENLFIEGGYLKIQPIYNEATPFEAPYCSDKSCSYTWPHTSARVITSSKKIFKNPSSITVCFKVPDGSGHWPALWFLPQGTLEGTKSWPADGEIDVMEAKGRVANEVGSTIHFGNTGNRQLINQTESVPMTVNFHDKFHSITFEWTENVIKMYLDTQETPFFNESSNSTAFNNYSYPFNEEFFLILNVASGGNYDSSGGVDTSMFCQNQACSNLEDPDRGRLLIDYIEYKSID